LFRRVYLYHCNFRKLHIKLQMISFVFSDYDYYYLDYLQKLHCFCLVVNPNTLGGKPKVYCGTNLGGKPRLSCIRTLFVLFFLQNLPPPSLFFTAKISPLAKMLEYFSDRPCNFSLLQLQL